MPHTPNNANDNALGDLVSDHHAKPNFLLIVLFVFFALVLAVSGFGILLERQFIVGLGLLLLSTPFFGLAWFFFSLGKDELGIHTNGFTYRRRGTTQTCLWSELETLTFLSGRSNTFTISVSNALTNDRGVLVAATKKSGKTIQFNEGLRCGSDIIAAIKASRTKGR